MPLHSFPGQFGSQRNAVQRTNTTIASATHTSPAGTHTYNATWTQLVASTAFDSHMFMVRLGTGTAATANRSDYIMQLGIGAAGSEQVVFEAPIGFKGSGTTFCLPLWIPAGSRVAVRHKGNAASKGLAYTFEYYGSPNRDNSGIPQKWVCYGKVDSGTQSSGTAVTAGSTTAWGSWTALTTSTSNPHELWVPVIDAGTVATTTGLSYRSQFAIASTTDAATMVTNGTVWEGPSWSTTTAEAQTSAWTGTLGSWLFGLGLPDTGIIYDPKAAGAAVSMRAMCSGAPEASVAGSILAAVM